MKKYVLPIPFLFLLLTFSLFGQDYFQILSGEGESFSLVRNGVKQNFKVAGEESRSILIGEGDYLLTGEGTFLELSSRDFLLMVGENSALTVDSLNLKQGSLLTLSYGHVHALLKQTPAGDVWIAGSDTVCRLSRGEFGFLVDYDMTMDQPEILTRVYSMDGQAEIRQRLADDSLSGDKRVQYKDPVLIEQGEMVIASNWEKDLPLLPSFFDSDYAGYWALHPFSGMAPSLPLVTQTDEQPVTRITEEVKDRIDVKENTSTVDREYLLKTGQAAFVLGALSMTGASLTYMLGQGTAGNALAGFGLFNLAVGTGVYGYSYLTSPETGSGE